MIQDQKPNKPSKRQRNDAADRESEALKRRIRVKRTRIAAIFWFILLSFAVGVLALRVWLAH